MNQQNDDSAPEIGDPPSRRLREWAIGLLVLAAVALVALRVFAATQTIPIRTWDDSVHRRVAQQESTQISATDAVRQLVVPPARNI